jgi:GDP/UDP-N,N'-diacetylbacillosamine 2-epimerase (hydrolysing)
LKKKIAVTTGARSEYGILRPVLLDIKKSKKLELYLIVSGMHLSKKYGLTINEIEKDGFEIYKTIRMAPTGDSSYHMSKSLGGGVIKFSKVFRELKPDINLILGDRDEAFASALAASHMNIPNAHIHGGDKSKAGIDEYNRHAITKISNIHFTVTKKSMERVKKMGENPKFIFNTGSPSIDEVVNENITNKKTLEKKYKLCFSCNEIILVFHPVTTQTEKTEQYITNLLNAVIKFKKQTIVIAPNSDASGQIIFNILQKYSKNYSFIKLYKSLPRGDYLSMLKNGGVLVGNSSSGVIEAGYFDISVVNIGIRQDGREHGNNVIDVTNETNSIINGIEKAFKLKNKKFRRNNIYGDGKSSEKIVKHLEKIIIDKKLIQKQIFY